MKRPIEFPDNGRSALTRGDGSKAEGLFILPPSFSIQLSDVSLAFNSQVVSHREGPGYLPSRNVCKRLVTVVRDYALQRNVPTIHNNVNRWISALQISVQTSGSS